MNATRLVQHLARGVCRSGIISRIVTFQRWSERRGRQILRTGSRTGTRGWHLMLSLEWMSAASSSRCMQAPGRGVGRTGRSSRCVAHHATRRGRMVHRRTPPCPSLCCAARVCGLCFHVSVFPGCRVPRDARSKQGRTGALSLTSISPIVLPGLHSVVLFGTLDRPTGTSRGMPKRSRQGSSFERNGADSHRAAVGSRRGPRCPASPESDAPRQRPASGV